MSNIMFMFFRASLWCLILTKTLTKGAQTTKCSEGTYLHQLEDNISCVECKNGTFMPWKNHTADTCFDCTKVEDPNTEILISPCDRFHEADVQCVEGYFRRLARNPREKPVCLTCRHACPEHHYQVHPCQNFSDLGCCPGENYDYAVGNGGVRMCRERPWMCRRGQYLDTGVNDCKPCTENTFMPEDYHSHIECWDCRYHSEADLPLHTVIIQPCTSTQSPRYGCKEGYYVNHVMSYRRDDIGCSPCQTCDEGKYVGRQCDMYNDTVCCDKPNMNVVDGPQGAQCVDKIDCKDGSYNPPDCDKTCSQHCRPSERSDVSLCDNNNGTCLFGCVDGYTGDTCETVQDTKEINDRNWKDASTVALRVTSITLGLLLLLVFITVVTCVIYHKLCSGSGPRWWQRLVRYIFEQPETAASKELVQLQPLMSASQEEHQRFISTDVFNAEHLPSRYRDKRIVDYARATSNLTCCLSVSHARGCRSEASPGGDTTVPLSIRNGENFTRAGTGWVSKVCMFTEGKCECQQCCRPGKHTAKKKWGEVHISTACQVVHDDDEARHTKCQFFNDSKLTNNKKVFTLKGLKLVATDNSGDWCDMKYVTHDVKLLDTFSKMYELWENLRDKVYNAYVSNNYPGVCVSGVRCDENVKHDLCIIVSYPYGCSKTIAMGTWTQRHLVDKDDRTENIKYDYNTPTGPGSEGAPVIILGNTWPLRFPAHSQCRPDNNNSSGVGRERVY